MYSPMIKRFILILDKIGQNGKGVPSTHLTKNPGFIRKTFSLSIDIFTDVEEHTAFLFTIQIFTNSED